MTTEEKLSAGETWEGEHLSELALSCIADAQDIVDPVARVHAESCAHCAIRIGAMALESHDVGAALRRAEIAPARAASVSVAHRFPTLLVAAAVVIASICGAPALLDGAPRALTLLFAAPHMLPALTTSFVALAHGFKSSASGAAVSLVTTFALVLFGYGVARASRASHGVSR